MATEFYEAADTVAAAQVAILAAEQQQAIAVARLSELGQTDDQIATLCAIPVKQVRDLRRRATTETAGATTAASSAPADPAPAESSATETAPIETAAA